MSNILNVIKSRRSIRKFQKKEIPEKILDELIEALIWAPSAGNLQSRKFYFVFNEGVKEKLVEKAGVQSFITQAPLVIVTCTNWKITHRYGKKGKQYSICDTAMSIQNIMLQAHNLGLGSVPLGAFDKEEVSKILNLPEDLKPFLIVPVGYPAEKPSPPPRVSKREAVEFVT